MKRRFPYSILIACLLLGLPAMSSTAYSQVQVELTETEILTMLNAVDRASRRRNIAGIVAPLASDVKIKLTITTPQSPNEQVMRLTKAQYVSNVRTVFRHMLDYQLERKNTRIKIYNDQKTAMVSSDIYETMTLRQGKLRAVSSEVAIVNLRKGKVVITSIEGRTRIY